MRTLFIEEYTGVRPHPHLPLSQFRQLEQEASIRRKFRQEDIACGIALAFQSQD